MTDSKMGQGHGAARWPLAALALASVAAAPLAGAQENGNPSPAPSSSRPIDFRLPPADDGRTPGVQGPADNGLPPIAPGERPGAQPTPAPAPTPAPPRVAPTRPATTRPATTTSAEPAAPARRDTPSPAARRAAPDAGPDTRERPATSDGAASPPLEEEAAGTAAPPDTATRVVDDAPAESLPDAVSTGDSAGTPLWAWLLAALAALAAGFWYWRRRPVAAAPAPAPAPDEGAGEPPQPQSPRAVAPAMRPAPRPAPEPDLAPARAASNVGSPRAASPLVTRASGEQRAIVGMTLTMHSIQILSDHVAVGFTLHLQNQGNLPATGLMVRVALGQGSAMPEAVLARFFDGAGGSVLRDDIALTVGAGEDLSTEVMLPRAAIEPLMIGGKPMLVPVIAFDVTYHWDGEGEAFGQNAGSFVLGREQGGGGSEKLAPLPLDRASYRVDHPGARATALKRAQ
ncbi:hypothetical protein [Sphingopyxis sp. JAI128]|uniref:hypothetical protein n=1 Tax=Sphingopyxis sp. JAI128 TaxID=2723066 RepID=UPI001815EEA0|nr:hypothetical protein [Sphingopyxis sp. JAI128]MBB6426758.1 hypothetical protein [Sphingopyxis sp. JAI128]